MAFDERDHVTYRHCGRVAGLCLELGRRCSLSEHDLRILQTAAVFHDIGKIRIPDRVLMKETPFTDDDWALVKTHSAEGQHIIVAAGLDDADAIGLVVRHHHERYDGAGYPDGLAGDSIPYMSRIVALADTYDAMAWPRAYRPAQPHDLIMQVLALEQGWHHDPYLVAKFARLFKHGRSNAKHQVEARRQDYGFRLAG